MSQNSKYLFPTRSSLVKEPEAVASAASVSISGEAGTYPARSSLSTTFFSNPEVFFSRRSLRISPRRRSGNLSRHLLAVNNFFRFFSKNFLPRRARPPGPARLNGTLCPAAARTGYAPLRDSCQRLFIFFLIFFSTPDNAPVSSGV